MTVVVAPAVVLVDGAWWPTRCWTSTCTGDGTATAGTSTDFIVTVDDPNDDPRTPGGLPGQTLAYAVSTRGRPRAQLQLSQHRRHRGQDSTSVISGLPGIIGKQTPDGSDWTALPDCSDRGNNTGHPIEIAAAALSMVRTVKVATPLTAWPG